MRAHFRTAVTAVALLAATFAGAGLAEAKCKRMGFLVNDYGKDGPAKDAQALLDKHVEKWAAENGITNYTIGKKDVSCELYLNLILFDEHTCTASANVCWDEPGTKKKESSSAKSDKNGGDAAKAAQNDKKDDSASKAADSDKTEAEAVKAADAPKPDKASAPVETGAVPATPAANDAAAKPAVDPDAAERAAAAAERAAEAAERAAAAAERAADAAKAKEATVSPAPSQMEMPSFGAGSAASSATSPAAVEPVKPATPTP